MHTQSRRKTKQPGRMPVLAPPCLLRTACAFVHLTVRAQVWATLGQLVLTCTLAVDRHPSPQAFSSSDPRRSTPTTHTRQCSLILGGGRGTSIVNFLEEHASLANQHGGRLLRVLMKVGMSYPRLSRWITTPTESCVACCKHAEADFYV